MNLKQSDNYNLITVNPANNQPTLTLTLESTGIFLGILVSFSMLLGGTVKVITKFNSIGSAIRDLREDLNANAKALEQLKTLNSQVLTLDKKVDLHLQDYINYKDANLLQNNNLNEKINHTWNKTEKLLNEQKGDIKDISGFLQKQQNFVVRE